MPNAQITERPVRGRARRNGRRPKSRPLPQFTASERQANGKAVRSRVPRSAHGEWQPAADRPDPVELLKAQAVSRVPELVPLRHARMLVSPFTFFRGAAAHMAADLADAPRTSLEVQLCGDAHLSNFGGFAAPDRRLVFSVNDFDETLPGPFEWDVKRLVASFAVAGRDRGFDAKTRNVDKRDRVARRIAQAMRGFARMGNLELWYARIEAEDLARAAPNASRKQVARFEQNVAKAQSKDSLKAFAKLTEIVDGELRIVSDAPLIVPVEEVVPAAEHHRIDELVRGVIRSYRRSLAPDRRRLLERYRYVHMARKVVGVGSVGTRAWIMLLVGRDARRPAVPPVQGGGGLGARAVPRRERVAHHGQRVVEGQRLMQAASDILLGWIRATDIDGIERDFYVRQLWDQKGSALVESDEPEGDGLYAELCGTDAREGARALR